MLRRLTAEAAPPDPKEQGRTGPMSTDELLARARARTGSVLGGKYRLDAVLGVGGMASVFAATHLRNANRVAVKVLHRELAIDADLRARFLREGYASNTVEHPAAVRILDDDAAEDGSVFLVMELLDGEPLDVRWERAGRRLPVPEVVSTLWQLLDVLAAAHARGIIHRDLKPQNLFLTREGRLKLLDFGVARLRELSPTMTRSGALVGTPAFMAPEQALGRKHEIDALSDIWAVGATGFALLAGRFVHVGETPEEILVRAATERAQALRAVAPEVPPALAEVIDRALAYAKADRWPSARAMQQALTQSRDEGRSIAATSQASAVSVPPRPPPLLTPSSVGGLATQRLHPGGLTRREIALLVAGAVVLVAFGAGLTTLATRRGAVTETPPSSARPPPAPAPGESDRAPQPVVEPAPVATAVLAPTVLDPGPSAPTPDRVGPTASAGPPPRAPMVPAPPVAPPDSRPPRAVPAASAPPPRSAAPTAPAAPAAKIAAAAPITAPAPPSSPRPTSPVARPATSPAPAAPRSSAPSPRRDPLAP
ncbi:MAG: serine/threonine protein kinase [Myxococcales bacterium]|nr:serine/threonine protein kinase [Myxococcales bacterium]